MKTDKLNLIQNKEKLTGGFVVLSTNKLKQINGGFLVNETCTNKTAGACRDSLNMQVCANYKDTCADSVNKRICRELY